MKYNRISEERDIFYSIILSFYIWKSGKDNTPLEISKEIRGMAWSIRIYYLILTNPRVHLAVWLSGHVKPP